MRSHEWSFIEDKPVDVGSIPSFELCHQIGGAWISMELWRCQRCHLRLEGGGASGSPAYSGHPLLSAEMD